MAEMLVAVMAAWLAGLKAAQLAAHWAEKLADMMVAPMVVP